MTPLSHSTLYGRMQPEIVFGIKLGSLLRRKERKYSMFLTLKTLVYHRCKFSIPISKCSTHKFSIKINWEHIKMHIKMGVIVFDIQCFNWNQAAELQSCFDGSMVSISRGDSWLISWGTLHFLQRETNRWSTSLFSISFMVNRHYSFFFFVYL